jgi:hypothetical protein
MDSERWVGVALVLLLAVGVCTSCEKPNDQYVPPDPERADAGSAAPTTRDAAATLPDGPGTTIPADPGCPAGQHTCADACVRNDSPLTCGNLCTPCPAPQGGSAACDGIKCSVLCPAGSKPCLDKCVDQNAACDGTCPAGQNACSGICVDTRSLSACGTSCTPCPTSANGDTTCDGDKCDLKCKPGFHRCGDVCVADGDVKHCGTSCTPCEAPTGGGAMCDGAKCGSVCPDGTKLCAGACIPINAPCNGQCPAGRHDCSGNCTPNTDVNSCGVSCAPCRPPDNAEATCDGNACGFRCRPGYHACGPDCRSNNSVESCGDRCSRCEAPPGGQPTCSNGQCDFTCPTGRKCGGRCAANDDLCGGSCGQGYRVCMGACVANATITTETCDGKDNDCDGQVDENLSRDCSAVCGAGKQACSNGTWGTCVGSRNPTAEACNGTDDDCNGVNDDGSNLCASDQACQNGRCVPICGGIGQDCCDNTRCNSGGRCIALKCLPCGKERQKCCQMNSCQDGLVCSDATGRIYNGTNTDAPDAICHPCGKAHSSICCPGYKCENGLKCIESAGFYCVQSCGSPNESCCVSSSGQRFCNFPFTCDNAGISPACH